LSQKGVRSSEAKRYLPRAHSFEIDPNSIMVENKSDQQVVAMKLCHHKPFEAMIDVRIQNSPAIDGSSP
jgi:hypothetical protein